MRPSLLAFVLLAALAGASEDRWLARDDGSPWPRRVILTTTGVGPVTENVSSLQARSFMLLADRPTLLAGERMAPGAPGMAVPFSVRDTDGDGLGDEIRFVSEYPGRYALYHAPEPGPARRGQATIELSVDSAGSFVPLPRAARQGKHPDATRVQLTSLREEGPMLVITTPGCEIWLGRHSGLIERVRPRGFPWAGSCFREYVPGLTNTPDNGSLKVVEHEPALIRLHHDGPRSRTLEIWVDGTIFTACRGDWPDAKLVAAACPYTNARCGPDDPMTRFSEMLGSGRSLDSPGMALHGPAGDSVSCRIGAGRFTRQEVWPDGGELAQALAQELSHGGRLDAALFRAQTSWLLRTYIGGAAWVFNLHMDPAEPSHRLDYRFAVSLSMPAAHVGMQRATLGPVEEATQEGWPLSGLPEQGPRISVQPLIARVPRLHPAAGNGWELKPYRTSAENPLPAYFRVEVHRTNEQAGEVQATVEAEPWLERVDLLTERPGAPPLDTTSGSSLPAWQRVTVRRQNQRYPIRLPASEAPDVCFVVALKPIPDAQGTCVTALRVVTQGAASRRVLSFEVLPSIPLIADGTQTALNPQVAAMLGFNTWVTPGLLAAQDPSSLVDAEGNLTPAAVAALDEWEQGMRPGRAGLFRLEDSGLQQLLALRGRAATGTLSDRLVSMTAVELARFYARLLSRTRPWERWIMGHLCLSDPLGLTRATDLTVSELAALYAGFRAAALRPVLCGFDREALEQGLPSQIPCDIPGAICPGPDELVHRCVDLLVGGRRALHDRWLTDPTLAPLALADSDRQPHTWCALSAQAGVTDYATMRRQAWWCRQRGALEGGLTWITTPPDDDSAGCPEACGVVILTADGEPVGLTDRALALMDAHEDMGWITRLEMALGAASADPSVQAQVARAEALKADAYRLAAENRCDAAREAIRDALALLSPQPPAGTVHRHTGSNGD